MNVVLPVKPVEQLVPLGGTAWLLLLCSPGVVPDFLRPNRLRTNLLQTVKKKSAFRYFINLNDRDINAELLK